MDDASPLTPVYKNEGKISGCCHLVLVIWSQSLRSSDLRRYPTNTSDQSRAAPVYTQLSIKTSIPIQFFFPTSNYSLLIRITNT